MHYLVDLDNTLLDTFYTDENGKTQFYWSKNIYSDLGIHPHDLRDLFTFQFQTAMQETANLDCFIDAFLASNRLKLTAADFKNYWMDRDANLNADVYDWLKRQKAAGHTLHIASNQPHIRMDFLWHKFDEWHTLFDHVFTSSKFGVAKPDPMFFHLAQCKIGVPFDEICLIDDSAENVDVARSLGMNVILFKTPNDLE